MAMSYWRRSEQIRPRVQLFPWLVALPDLLSTAAIVSSGIWRARARTTSTTPVSLAHRDWPGRLRFTVRRVWSPPCQCTTISSRSPAMYAWMKLTLERIVAGWPNKDLDALMPWNHRP